MEKVSISTRLVLIDTEHYHACFSLAIASMEFFKVKYRPVPGLVVFRVYTDQILEQKVKNW